VDLVLPESKYGKIDKNRNHSLLNIFFYFPLYIYFTLPYNE
jgi:hypothetical protein